TINVLRVATSQDGHWLITGNADGTVRVRDLTDPALPTRWLLSDKDAPRGSKPIWRLYMSPDNHWLVTIGGNVAVNRLWDLSAANPAPKTYPLGNILDFEVSPNGHWLVTQDRGDSNGRGPKKLLDLTADDPVATSRTLPAVSVKDEPSIEDEDSLEEEYDFELFSPDSHWLCTNGSG